MNTPIFDFLHKFNNENPLRCFMPAHKGITPYELPTDLYKYDITEIKGADSLFEANGIISESEDNAAKLFKTLATVYSTSGSTSCIQAMLTIMKWEKRKIFAIRNVHRSFINAAALLDLDVEWIYPKYSDGILSGKLNVDDVEKALMMNDKPSCVYITSPDYTGKIADIKNLSRICKKYNARLLVDNAHGATLAFLEESKHPIHLGADLCCDSAHKTLPVLTGGAYLHTSRREYALLLKKAMLLFASTSPSYLTLLSLDICNRYLENNIRNDIVSNTEYIENFKRRFLNRLDFVEGEPFHITIKASECGYNGIEFADSLRKFNVECEYADDWFVVLLMSPVNVNEDYEKLSDAINKTLNILNKTHQSKDKFYLPILDRKLSIHDAVFSESEEINVDESLGRICGAVNVPCPPAIPIAVSGEVINNDIINIFKKYSIFTVNVIK